MISLVSFATTKRITAPIVNDLEFANSHRIGGVKAVSSTEHYKWYFVDGRSHADV